MRPNQVVNYYGSEIKAAAALGKSRLSIGRWVKQGYIPIWSQFAIEAISGGRLKASEKHLIKEGKS